jgi:hypothetical protein
MMVVMLLGGEYEATIRNGTCVDAGEDIASS